MASAEKVRIGKTRLEAFSDGLIAIIITIMVLELKVPHGGDMQSLLALAPTFLSYILSFLYLAIYWNNHHHMIHTCKSVNGAILWANLHLLFWLSLVPFATGWMGQNHFSGLPTFVYGVVLLMASLAYSVLQTLIISSQGPDSILKKAMGRDLKGKISPMIYISALISALHWPEMALTLYCVVAFMWIVPDSRIEKMYRS